MGVPARNLVGHRFGRLVVEAFATCDAHHRRYWVCRCDCGRTVTVRTDHIDVTRACASCAARARNRARRDRDREIDERLRALWADPRVSIEEIVRRVGRDLFAVVTRARAIGLPAERRPRTYSMFSAADPRPAPPRPWRRMDQFM